MSEQSQGTKGIRDARTLGIPKMLLLGIQHMFAMFGATILVPILTNVYFEGEGLSVQVTLICAGLAIAGIVMNAILPGNDYEFGTNEKGDENRGIHA